MDIPKAVSETLEICATEEGVDPDSYKFTGEVTPGGVYVFRDMDGKEFGADEDRVFTGIEFREE